MSSKQRDRVAERRSKSPDLHKMKAVASMFSGEEENIEKAGASYDEQGGDKQQSILDRRSSAESQEFEFNKLEGLTSPHMSVDQLHEGGLASADELFYKGQLLPLQYNTRAPPYVNSVTNSPISSWHDTIEIPSSKLSISSLRDQDVRFSSCRMDHVGLDSSLFDFTRSSSFRSHSSYYCNYYANYGSNCTGFWDSSTTTSCAGESTSTSSSRDSNGSSQDSYSSSDHNKEQQHVCCHCHASAGVNGPFSPKRKPGLIQSWKILFNGFRRSSHSTAAWGEHQAAHNPNLHGSLSARAAANPHAANDQGSKLAACQCKLSKEKPGINERHIRSPTSRSSLLWAQEKEKGRSNGSQISRDSQSPNCNNKERETRRGFYSRGSRWQGYTRRIKPISIIKATLVRGQANYDHDHIAAGSCNNREQKGQAGEGGWPADQGRVTCHMSSMLEGRLSQPASLVSVVSGVKGPSKVSFRFHAVSSSCPASVRSSPNHSGLLASPANHSGMLASPTNFNNMSTMQELQSAVQGAIAHCKQSISTPSS